jgi:hypothetical protein
LQKSNARPVVPEHAVSPVRRIHGADPFQRGVGRRHGEREHRYKDGHQVQNARLPHHFDPPFPVRRFEVPEDQTREDPFAVSFPLRRPNVRRQGEPVEGSLFRQFTDPPLSGPLHVTPL